MVKPYKTAVTYRLPDFVSNQTSKFRRQTKVPKIAWNKAQIPSDNCILSFIKQQLL